MIQGLVILVVGMATVIAFLVVLVAMMYASAGLLRVFPRPVSETTALPQRDSREDLAEIAVAIAAIQAQSH